MAPLGILGYFVGYLVQGMAEEVLCRGYLFVSLSKTFRRVFGSAQCTVLCYVTWCQFRLDATCGI